MMNLYSMIHVANFSNIDLHDCSYSQPVIHRAHDLAKAFCFYPVVQKAFWADQSDLSSSTTFNPSLTPRDARVATSTPIHLVRPKSSARLGVGLNAGFRSGNSTPRSMTPRVPRAHSPLDTAIPPLDLNDVGSWSDPEDEYRKVTNDVTAYSDA